MIYIRVFVITTICTAYVAQCAVNKPLNHKSICHSYAGAVVRIDTGRPSSGTGFVVSDDGLILTAAHVVLDPQTGKVDEAISVTFPGDLVRIARQVLPVEQNMFGRDFALLKVDDVLSKVQHIDLGDTAIGDKDLEIGSDITIIGFPFSAVAFHQNAPSVKDKFCLSGSIAYVGQTEVVVGIQTSVGPGTVKVNVDLIYFQGPSVKGLSGSPIISNNTGRVIGILTSKLTGITEGLAVTRQQIAPPGQPVKGGIDIGPIDIAKTTAGLIDTLDTQLANGLGAGTGIEDAKAAMRHFLRQPPRAHHK